MRVLIPFLAAALTGGVDEQSLAYKYWSKCSPGSWVRIRMEIQQSTGKVIIEETNTLLERTPDKVVLGFTRVTNTGGVQTILRDQKRTIPARAPVPEKIEKETTEEIKVGGKTVTCRRLEMVKEQGNTKLRIISWATSEIPGGIARTEIKPQGASQVAIRIEAQEWKKK